MSTTSTRKRLLSKSRFVNGNQCHLRLWNEVFEPELAEKTDEKLQSIFDTGHEVGELACQRYPGGCSIEHDHLHFEEALAATRQLLESNEVPALFEAAFIHSGVRVRVDVLERMPGGGWRLVEVKSSTQLSDTYVLDAALQLWVLLGAGMDVREVSVLTLNRDYVYQGGEHDLDALFTLHHISDRAIQLQESIANSVQEMQTVLAQPGAPSIEPSGHCFEPYHCPFYSHCTRDIVFPKYGIDDLHRLHISKRKQLEDEGIDEIKNIDENFPLSDLQQIIRQAVIQDRDIIHGNIASHLAKLQSPVRHLDFETINRAIPRFVGNRPYDQIPFLFSVHVEGDGAQLRHVEYLHESASDPCKPLVERLINALGERGSICVYSHYERTTLSNLCRWLPECADELKAIQSRLVDLLAIIKNSYYHPDFHGSFSLKSVLPVMVPGSGYEDLSIADGQMASVLYGIALETSDDAERERIFHDLRRYCERDTLATVQIRQRLESLASS